MEKLFVALGVHVGMIAVAFGALIAVVFGATGSNGPDRDEELALIVPGVLWGAAKPIVRTATRAIDVASRVPHRVAQCTVST